ncbi:iron chaperone [Larkinella sp.]|uniref:iron chaperone n=1 Tax=Larkinella sp. TaxID=2034517 RepID=UPI003BA994DD
MNKPASIDVYIAGFPPQIQERLQQIRETVQKAAPDAEEIISYNMPTFRLNGYLIHFAAHKNHIGMYPAPKGNDAFQEALAPYKGSKSTVQFVYNKPLPLALITDLIQFRIAETGGKVLL